MLDYLPIRTRHAHTSTFTQRLIHGTTMVIRIHVYHEMVGNIPFLYWSNYEHFEIFRQ